MTFILIVYIFEMASNQSHNPGEFREGRTRELVLEDVTVDAFDVMMRTAYHLEPKLTPPRAINTLKAAKLYMIEDLEKYCWDYLRDLEGLDSTLILQTLTECLKCSFDLPEELQCAYWSNILSKSASVVQSPFFVETHGSVIAKLVKLDEFHVNEETLWNRLVEWSASAVQKPELLGPFADATPCQPAKRAKTNDDDSNSSGPSETAQRDAILQFMSPHIRFIQMKKDFFVDKVRQHLDRKDSDAVIDYFLLGRESEGLLAKRRDGLKDPIVKPEESFPYAQERKLKFERPILVTKVELSYIQYTGAWTQPSFRWTVTAANQTFEQSTNFNGTSVMVIALQDPCDELVIDISGCRYVQTVHVTGKKCTPRVELADLAVQRLSKDLLMTPQRSLGSETSICAWAQRDKRASMMAMGRMRL